MTIKAYHATSSEAFERILEGGAILPASMRVDPEALRVFCNNALSAPRYSLFSSLREVIEALRGLVDEKANELKGREFLWPTQDDPEEFHASCLEYTSGGTDFVYLQARDWERKVVEIYSKRKFSGGRLWGFVFDAEDLIRKGGLLFFNTLNKWLQEELFATRLKKLDGKRDAREFVLATIDAFFRDDRNVKFGEQALRDLRSGGQYYMGWEGPLPIYLATEIWKEGRLVHDLGVE